MSIIRRRHNSRFRAMPNALFEDERISFDARGMIGYLLVKPDHWSVNVKDLCRAGSIGRDKVYKLLAELVDAGYIIRHQPRDKDGRVGAIEYIVMDDPMSDAGDEAALEPLAKSPLPEIPDTAFPDTDSPDTVNPHRSKESVCSKDSNEGECAADAAPASSSQTSRARQGGKRDLHFEALAEMCGLQTNRLSPGNRIQLGKHAASLAGDGVSPEFIRACGSSWYTKKFGWKDRAEVKPPSPAQAAEWVGQEVEAKKRGRVPDGAKIIDGKTVFWSPDASKADIVWKI